MSDELVQVEGVTKTFRTAAGAVRAVDGVDLTVGVGSTVGVVGESGSGKSTLARLVLGFLRPDTGRVTMDGHVIGKLSYGQLRRLRSEMTVVFQEPLGSLNPRMKVLDIVREPLDIHRRTLPVAGRNRVAAEALDRVRIPSALFSRYPRALSGGQQQRVNIARAIVTGPRFIVLDEPTSALDLSVQAQILHLLSQLQTDLGLSYLFISHDMGCIGFLSDQLAVMYRGRIVERGACASVLDNPLHPYTRRLLSARLLPVSAAGAPVAPHASPAEGGDDSRDAVLTEVEADHFVAR